MWNHSGIAVRIKDDGSISRTEDGRLYILEINTWARKDAITGEMVIGAGYSDFNWMKERYNIVAIRPMKDKYRTDEFIAKISDFINRHRGLPFTTDLGPFFSVWVGLPLGENSTRKGKSMFCSEFMSYFYTECLGLPMRSIFGDNGPELPNLCTPEHFSASGTSGSKVFDPFNVTVYMEHSDMGCVLIPVLLFTIFLAVLLWSLLPRSH